MRCFESSPKLRRFIGTSSRAVAFNARCRSRRTRTLTRSSFMKRPLLTFYTALAVGLSLAPQSAQPHDDHDHAASGGRPPATLGKVSFPTSCDPTVQREFERGVA